ncbi:hypothetical protein DL96DRAFT_1230569 [Flagelloscypha sp. PMI_526]|nr:hypothetical protein DL96DRAFT_1230569 [Flagelloscypha sp. PMI_526]
MFLAHLARTHHPAQGVETVKPVSIGFFDNPGDFKSIKALPTKRGGKKRKLEDNVESGRISKRNTVQARPTPGPSSSGGASSSHSHVPVTPHRPAPTLHSLLTPPPGFAGSSPLAQLDSSLFSGTTNSLISFGQPMFSSPVRSQTPPRALPSFQSSTQVSRPSTPLFLPVSSPAVEPMTTPPPHVQPLTPTVPSSEKEPANGQSPTQATTSQLHYDYSQDPFGALVDTSPMLTSIGMKPHVDPEGDSLPYVLPIFMA